MIPKPDLAIPSLIRVAAALFALLVWGADARAGLPEVVQRVKPAVVSIGTFQKTRSPSYAFRGTGFAVGDGTLIATNAHVLPEKLKAEEGEVLLVLTHKPGSPNPEGRTATVVVVDTEHDLALLRIGGSPLPALTIGDSDAVREGQSIAITGFPIGQVLGFHAVTHRGIVSSLTPMALPAANSAQLDTAAAARLRSAAITLFQLDVTIFMGHSGSPAYDEDSGAVLGVVNIGYMRRMKDPAEGQANISFAVPSRYLRDLMGKAPP